MVRTPTEALIIGTVVLARITDDYHPDVYQVKVARIARWSSHANRAVVLNKVHYANGQIAVTVAYADDTGKMQTARTLPLDPGRPWRQYEPQRIIRISE